MVDTKQTDYDELASQTPEKIQTDIENYVLNLKRMRSTKAMTSAIIYSLFHFFAMNRVILNEKIIKKLLPEQAQKEGGKAYSTEDIRKIILAIDDTKIKKEDDEHWHKEIWKDIIKLELGIVSMDELQDKYENKYALQKLAISKPRVLNRLKQFNGEETDYHEQVKPFNFAILGFSNLQNGKDSELIKPIAPYNKIPRHVVSDDFIDYNAKKEKKTLRGVQYWKQFWDLFGRYLDNKEKKLEGDRDILKRKHMFLEKIVHIGKESDNLDYVEVFGADENSVEVYEDKNRLNEQFLKNKDEISRLSAKYVEDKTGIPRSTFWRAKINLENNNYEKTSDRVKIALLSCLN